MVYAGRAQSRLRLHQGLLRDRFHRRPEAVRHSHSDHPRGGRPVCTHCRHGCALGQDRQERDSEGLSGSAPRPPHHAQGPVQRGSALLPTIRRSNPMTNSQQPNDALAGKLKRTELQHRASSIPGREIVQVLTEIPAGVESGWHMHPGEEVGYILAGTVEMMIQGQPTLTLHAGDPFLMPPRTPHNALDLGPETGMMLSTYIVEVGQPLATFTGSRPAPPSGVAADAGVSPLAPANAS